MTEGKTLRKLAVEELSEGRNLLKQAGDDMEGILIEAFIRGFESFPTSSDFVNAARDFCRDEGWTSPR